MLYECLISSGVSNSSQCTSELVVGRDWFWKGKGGHSLASSSSHLAMWFLFLQELQSLWCHLPGDSHQKPLSCICIHERVGYWNSFYMDPASGILCRNRKLRNRWNWYQVMWSLLKLSLNILEQCLERRHQKRPRIVSIVSYRRIWWQADQETSLRWKWSNCLWEKSLSFYTIAKNPKALCPWPQILRKIELESDELSYLTDNISKQDTDIAGLVLLIDFQHKRKCHRNIWKICSRRKCAEEEQCCKWIAWATGW